MAGQEVEENFSEAHIRLEMKLLSALKTLIETENDLLKKIKVDVKNRSSKR